MSKLTKKMIFEACEDTIATKRKVLNTLLLEIKKSTETATKSSAGDKHETARALAQFEQENLAKQFSHIEQLERNINLINPNLNFESIKPGAMVITDKLCLFFGLALGKISIEKKTVFAVSMASPIGQSALGKKTDEVFLINEVKHTVLEIN